MTRLGRHRRDEVRHFYADFMVHIIFYQFLGSKNFPLKYTL